MIVRLNETTLKHTEASVNTSSLWLCGFPSKVTLPAPYSLSSSLLQFTMNIWCKRSHAVGFGVVVKEGTMGGDRVFGLKLESILGEREREAGFLAV